MNEIGDMHLCFQPEEFLSECFNVDAFVSACKDRVSMGNLREDLESHYKVIQSSLVELINQDYADFVSLSSNLIGTDQKIEGLITPLTQLRDEVMRARVDLGARLEHVEGKVRERQWARERKLRLQHIVRVVQAVEKIERILSRGSPHDHPDDLGDEQSKSSSAFLERIAGEFNQLQFHVGQCKAHPIVESIKPRLQKITDQLKNNLEKAFLDGLESKKPANLLQCLRTFALIDKTSYAEDLFQRTTVKSFLGGLVTEATYNEIGLNGICEAILQFIDNECTLLLQLTSDEPRSESAHSLVPAFQEEETVKGFDFLVNAIWPEVVAVFEENLPFIFSPGNPDMFLQRYNTMMAFIGQLEENCCSMGNLRTLRSRPSYQTFLGKWSMPVYFQIRFQDIAGSVECAVDNAFARPVDGDASRFSTCIAADCLSAISRCWNEDVFVAPLKGRFWKLTLQILNRLASFMRTRAATTPGLSISEMMSLVADSELLKSDVTDLFTNVVEEKIRRTKGPTDEGPEGPAQGPTDLTIFRAALNEAHASITIQCGSLVTSIVSNIVSEACSHLDNVKNVPRLYRRTNKDPPTTHSAYVVSAFQPITTFRENQVLPQQLRIDVVEQAAKRMTVQYMLTVDELLSSIKKTEDSLMRLKRQRKSSAVNTKSALNKEELSDDQKARQQIYLDTLEYGRQLQISSLLLGDVQSEYNKLRVMTHNAVEEGIASPRLARRENDLNE